MCHAGLGSALRAAVARCALAAERLDDVGMDGLARRMRALEAKARGKAPSAAADAWIDAAVRANLAREAI